MIEMGLLLKNLGWCFWPLGATCAVAVYAALSYVWMRWVEGEPAAKAGGALRVVAQACGASQLAGMMGTLAGLVAGLGKMTPGDPSSIKHLIGALSVSMWTTYVGLVTAIFGGLFLLFVHLGGMHGERKV